MSDPRDDLDRQIAELEGALLTTTLPAVRQLIVSSLGCHDDISMCS